VGLFELSRPSASPQVLLADPKTYLACPDVYGTPSPTMRSESRETDAHRIHHWAKSCAFLILFIIFFKKKW
jgi:hypothetical protein